MNGVSGRDSNTHSPFLNDTSKIYLINVIVVELLYISFHYVEEIELYPCEAVFVSPV
jgi:hypothetical protein